MKSYQFILQPYKGMNTRFHCPACKNRQKTFTRYIDTQTGAYLSDDVGKCNRDSNCGYHYTPKQFFQDNPNADETLKNDNVLKRNTTVITRALPVISFISEQTFKASLNSHIDNRFVQFLTIVFGTTTTNQLIEQYNIGSCKYWQGGTVFWQIDIEGNVRTGKIMLYDAKTGKRVKEPYNHVNWVHALKNRAKEPLYPGYNLKQCFFGEHLLSIHRTKTVAIVESEKTAIIASAYLPQCIWLACGSKDGLNAEKCSVLKDRNVILYPDLKCYDRWNDITGMLANVNISDLLERNATQAERESGLDLADFLLKVDYSNFIKQYEPKPAEPKKPEQQQNLTKPDISPVYSNCFEGISGKIYIQNPSAPNRYASYTSAEAYNDRRELPDYIDGNIALNDFKQDLIIDATCLKIKACIP